MPPREGSSHSELHAGFIDADPRYSPVPLWWWSGDKVELPRLRWQLDRLAEQGVHNVVVMNLAPTGPLYGSLGDDPELLSEEWWDLWHGLVEHARRREVFLWFYDQIGFSGANLQGRLVNANPAYAGASLERVVADHDGPGRLECPAAGTPIAAAAVPLDAEGAVAGPPKPVEVVDRAARWEGDPAGARHRLMLAYSLTQGFDYTSPEACEALLDTVHGEFERRLGDHLGDVIVGSFQDELPDVPTWSTGLAEEFAERRGYRLEPVIAALWEDWGSESARVRADYQRVRAALAEDAFFRPLHAWHDKHGLIVGVDQQSPSRVGEPIGCTKQYADYARTHRWYSAPGSDHHGDAKIHSSLAHHYGRPRVWIEAFHSSGWGGTLEETFDWLLPWLLAGATLYDPHAVYYSTKGGWYEWAPPSTCWRQPYWRHYRHFADTVSRLCWLLTQGAHVADVGVLFPSATVQSATLLTGPLPAARRAHRAYLDLVGHMIWYRAKPGVLNRDDRDYDVLDDDTVAAARVEDGRLRTGSESFRAIVVPASAFLETATARVLAEFGERGGLLVFVGEVPGESDDPTGDGSGADACHRLRRLVDDGRAQLVAEAAEVPDVLERLGRPVRVDGPSLRRRVGDLNVLLVSAPPRGSATAQPMIPETANWQGHDYLYEHGYDFDPARNRSSTTVRIEEPVAYCEQWDPSTGTTHPVPVRAVDGGSEVEVDFTASPAGLLVWRTPEADEQPSTPAEPGDFVETAETKKADRIVELDGPWTARIVPTTDNTYGDLALPAHDGPLPLQQWRLRHRASTDEVDDERPADPAYDDQRWDSVAVGQGVWAWRTAPMDPSTAPDPLPPGHRGALAGDGWEPVRYSLTRGIENDVTQAAMLGPKGRVPEEFWHVDDVRAGQVVALRTTLPVAEAAELTLAVGTAGVAEVWWNGEHLGPDPGGYLRLDPVHAHAGPNLLELRVYAESDGPLRGYWTLTTDAERYQRPVWLEPGDEPARGSEVLASKTFRLSGEPRRALLQLGTDGPATLLVNGQELANQGAFEPYGKQNRVLPYDVTDALQDGANTLEVRLTDVGGPLAVLVDADVETAAGEREIWVSDSTWTFTRDGASVPTVLRRHDIHDPRWPLLRARPHPLPRAHWLEPLEDGALTGGVLDLVPEARPDEAKSPEWFRLVVPPGATAARLPIVAGELLVWLDGVPTAYADEDGHVRVPLAGTDSERRMLAVRATPADGRSGGALWDGPVEFEAGEGKLSAGPWADAGLASYSGGVAYRRTVSLPEVPARVSLDLGSVRGTAEVTVNGTSVGARIWSPYTFDLTEALRPGDNELEVVVFNTLGPYLDDASPTSMVLGGQRISGLLGPARLIIADA